MTEKQTLDAAERCALRLLSLCASPRKTHHVEPFLRAADASGNKYINLMHSLQQKGWIKMGKRLHPDAEYEIV